MDVKRIGDLLKSLRKAKGYTQQQVAEKLFISPKTVSKWESGLGIPDINLLSGIADFYEVSIDEILRGKKNDDITSNTMKHKPVFSLFKAKIIKRLNLFIYWGHGLTALGLVIALVLLISLAFHPGLSPFIAFVFQLVSVMVVSIGFHDYKQSIQFEEEEAIIQAFEETKNIANMSVYYYALITTIIGFLSVYIPLLNMIPYYFSSLPMALSSVLVFYPFFPLPRIINTSNKQEKVALKAMMYYVLFGVTAILIMFFGLDFQVQGETYIGLEGLYGKPSNVINTWFLDPLMYVFRGLNLAVSMGLLIHFVVGLWNQRVRKWMGVTVFLGFISSFLVTFDLTIIVPGNQYSGLNLNFMSLLWIPLMIIFYIKMLQISPKLTQIK